ncbi:MAG: hypothetical protein ACOYBY_07620 [Dermatophilaceae bacterium]
MSNQPSGPPPKRVRVTSPRRDARRRAAVRPGEQDLTEQTGLGEVYLTALLRVQLRLALRSLFGVGVILGGLPAVFLLIPGAGRLSVGPLPLPYLIVGFLVYPVVFFAARHHVRQAERIERDFAELVTRR